MFRVYASFNVGVNISNLLMFAFLAFVVFSLHDQRVAKPQRWGHCHTPAHSVVKTQKMGWLHAFQWRGAPLSLCFFFNC